MPSAEPCDCPAVSEGGGAGRAHTGEFVARPYQLGRVLGLEAGLPERLNQRILNVRTLCG